jgi:hypothetical protein
MHHDKALVGEDLIIHRGPRSERIVPRYRDSFVADNLILS